MVEDLTVRDVMTREYVGVSEADTVRDAAQLMITENQGAIAVLRGSKPVGMVLERELLRALIEGGDPTEMSIDGIMRAQAEMLEPHRTIAEAAAILAKADTDHVLVREDGELLGVVSENDVITAVTSLLTREHEPTYDEPDDPRSNVVTQSDVDDLSSQAVCEICGTLKADLTPINGQLVCGDCTDI